MFDGYLYSKQQRRLMFCTITSYLNVQSLMTVDVVPMGLFKVPPAANFSLGLWRLSFAFSNFLLVFAKLSIIKAIAVSINIKS